jgi:hypothetical protein
MVDEIEIRNEGARPIFASICKSKLTGRIYIHVSANVKDVPHKERVERIRPHYYGLPEIAEVEM